jgi:hypothetical protein
MRTAVLFLCLVFCVQAQQPLFVQTSEVHHLLVNYEADNGT